MNILITGSNSFIGKFLIPYFSFEGFNITATWNKTEPDFSYLPSQQRNRISLIKLNLSNSDSLNLLAGPFDSIIHISGISTHHNSQYEYIENNILPLNNLKNYAKKFNISKFIFLSTISVYGNVIDSLVTEETQIRNPDMYGISKLTCELLLKESGLNVLAIRIPSVLGLDAHRHWLSKILNLALSNSPIEIFNVNAKFNNAIHVNDLCFFIHSVIKSQWGGFHAAPIGSSEFLTIRDIVNKIIGLTNSKSSVKIIEKELTSFTISSDYLMENFNYVPRNIDYIIEKYVHETLADRCS